MKPLRAQSSVVCLLTSVLCLAAAPADSRITAVAVYADRAVVTRTASVDLIAGPQEIVFEKLPAALVDQSLQVSGTGTAQATILDVSARQTFVATTPNERIKALEDELRGLQKQLRVLADRVAAIDESRGFVKRLLQTGPQPLPITITAGPNPGRDGIVTDHSQPRLSLGDLQKLQLYADELLNKLANEQQALDNQSEEITAKKTALEKQLAELRGPVRKSFKTVTVRVSAAGAGKLDVALSYQVPGASWAPSYDARVLSGNRTVELSYFGVVRQNTGEDWKDVALTLSTARPSLGGAAPALTTWAVDVSRPAPVAMPVAQMREESSRMMKAMVAPSAAGSGAANLAVMADEAVQQMDAKVARATMEAAATSATFKLAAPASVPSDNSPQKVPVTTGKLAATPEYMTVPKRLAAAFLNAKVVNSSEFPLLAGAMNVFLEGTFVATSALRTVMPGEKFDLALGVDEGIAVKHKRVNRFAEDTGLTNSGKRVTYEFLITIQNNKRTAEKVQVQDQVPLSRHEKIVVKQLAPDPKETKPDNEGTLKWTLDLKPGEKRELTVKFSVDHPNDVTPTGLD
jgi:uncharacterized protein (TIGR02231 family)